MTSSHDLKQAFKELPSQITRRQILDATHRSAGALNSLIETYRDFPPLVGGRGNTHVRDRDAVLRWLLDHPELLGTRRGPQVVAQRARTASPGLLVTVKGLSTALGITREAVQYYTSHFTPEKSADPFPPATRQGRATVRSWPAVRSWLLRRDAPLPSGEITWPQLRSWLLAIYEQEKDEVGQLQDEHGLSLAQRDVLERVRVATALGHTVDAQWTADLLDLDEPQAVAELLAGGSPVPNGRLPLRALSSELGFGVHRLVGYARRYPAGCRDPFPPSDDCDTRDVEEVRAWLRRGDYVPDAVPEAKASGA
ncbi:hypothetical protein [Streptomyces sp. NPDC015125]|uniref:hypothetical protein n=1 Tax=Streptomyces sp. NPDC015125 TaxID=3364938 RepID=UPI0036F5CE9E